MDLVTMLFQSAWIRPKYRMADMDTQTAIAVAGAFVARGRLS
jgi:hypothetical protein